MVSGQVPKVSSLTIKLDSLTAPRTDYLSYFSFQNNSFLGWVNHLTSTVMCFDLKSKKLAMEFSDVTVKDPDRFHMARLNRAKPQAFFVAKNDLIVINEQNIAPAKSYSMTTKKVNEKASWIYSQRLRTITYPSNPLLKTEKTVFLTIDPMMEIGEPISNAKHSWIKAIDLNSTEANNIEFAFPENYLGKAICPSGLIPSVTMNSDDHIVIAWPFSQSLMIVNPATGEIDHKPVNTSFQVSDIVGLNQINTTSCAELYGRNQQFEAITFDSFKKLYYLFYTKEGINDTKNAPYAKTDGLIVLDENLRVISEMNLNASTFYTRNFFVSPEGLHISNHHHNNNKVTESELSFSVFDF